MKFYEIKFVEFFNFSYIKCSVNNNRDQKSYILGIIIYDIFSRWLDHDDKNIIQK